MGKIPQGLREIIARNIKECRVKKFPGRGVGKQCAEAFGVSPQQWSPWERGMRTPDELRLSEIADFFGVSVEWMRRDNRPPMAGIGQQEKPPSSSLSAGTPSPGIGRQDTPPHESPPFDGTGIAGAPPLSLNTAPGSPASFFWLAHRFMYFMERNGLLIDKQSLEYLAQCIKKN